MLELVVSILEPLTSIPLKRPRPASRSGMAICYTWRWSNFSTVSGTWPIFSSMWQAAATKSSTALGRKFTVKAFLAR